MTPAAPPPDARRQPAAPEPADPAPNDRAPIEIDLAQRLVRRAGVTLPLRPRAFDLLVALTSPPGAFFPHDALLRTVWRGRSVQPQNLRMQVAVLRQVLGARSIDHAPGHGYRYVGPIAADASGPPVEALVRAAWAHASRQEHPQAVDMLDRALEAYLHRERLHRAAMQRAWDVLQQCIGREGLPMHRSTSLLAAQHWRDLVTRIQALRPPGAEG